MKIRIDVDVAFTHLEMEEQAIFKMESRIYIINNPEELKMQLITWHQI